MARRRQQAVAAPSLARKAAEVRAFSVAALLPVLILCALPLLCIIHCQLSGAHGGAHAGHHGAAAGHAHDGHAGDATPAGHLGFALCDHMHAADGDALFIPAYWPGLPATSAALLAGLALLMRLGPMSATLLLSPALAPQTPPPR